MVKGQTLLSTLAVNSGSTVQTTHSVSITRLRTSALNWAARWIRPSRMLGRKGHQEGTVLPAPAPGCQLRAGGMWKSWA